MIRFKIRGLVHCQTAERLLDQAVALIQLAARRYPGTTDDEDPHVGSDDLAIICGPDAEIQRRVVVLMQGEWLSVLSSARGTPGSGDWVSSINDICAREFRGITSLHDYLAAEARHLQVHGMPAAVVRPTGISTQDLLSDPLLVAAPTGPINCSGAEKKPRAPEVSVAQLRPGTFDGPDWELAWPRSLFVSEGEWMLSPAARADSKWEERVALFLSEAFVAGAPGEAFAEAGSVERSVPDTDTLFGLTRWDFLERLVAVADQLPEQGSRRPYFSRRRGITTPVSMSTASTWDNLVRLIEDFYGRGYLDQQFPAGCVDDRSFEPVDASEVLERELGRPGLWPLAESRPRWDEDTFYDLVEVFHDLVARPRYRYWHDYGGEWHWGNFAKEPAQILYRWKANRLLAEAALPYRLADEGEDRGRLVAVSDDAREALVTAAVGRTDPGTGDRVRHAVALFRARGSDEHAVRSAILALLGVLEERRQLIERGLTRKDSGSLFQIANEFAMRHQRLDQKSDYEPAFLDWYFWWCLATVELTDRLMRRPSP